MRIDKKKIWFTWDYTLRNGIFMYSGANYASLSYALDAAMFSAATKKSTIEEIKVHPAKT